MHMNLSKTIRLLRDYHGYSQEYMAARLGVSQTTYCRIESDVENTKLKYLIRVCDILNIRIRDLFILSNRPPEDMFEVIDDMDVNRAK